MADRIRDLPGWRETLGKVLDTYIKLGAEDRIRAVSDIENRPAGSLKSIDPRTLNELARRVSGDNPQPGDEGRRLPWEIEATP